MEWWGIVLTADALCALVAVALSWIPAVALPITQPELVDNSPPPDSARYCQAHAINLAFHDRRGIQ